MFKNWLYVFAISMVPVIELRGGIPVGFGLGLPWWLCFILCVIGNMLPVPFILLFIRAIIGWMKKSSVKFFNKIAEFLEKKVQKKSQKVIERASLGLFLFVAIPLPGTGAWTGALIAAMLDMRMKYALPTIFAGVLAAGAVVTAIVYGGIGALQWLVG